MEVKDYISTYPRISTDFSNKIFHLKEFYEERLPRNPAPIIHGELLKHQKVIARFLSPMTRYRGLLVFHAVGTGKTCAAFAAAEANKHNIRRIFFLSPNQSLNNQQRNELITKCFPGIYSTRRRKIPGYTFDTPQRLAGVIRQRSSLDIYREFSNTLFIIDEAHKMRPKDLVKINAKIKSMNSVIKQLVTKNNATPSDQLTSKITSLKKQLKNLKEKLVQVQAYSEIQKVFDLADKVKIILMTATPMTDQASEIIDLMNLIIPKHLRFKKSDWRNPQILRRMMRGRISFLQAPTQSIQKKFISEIYSTKCGSVPCKSKLIPSDLQKMLKSIKINVLACLMGKEQTQVYLSAWCKSAYGATLSSGTRTWDDNCPDFCKKFKPPKRQNTLAYDAEQASLLIVPTSNGFIYGSKIKEPLKFFRKLRAKSNNIFENFYEYTPKYTVTLEKLKSNKKTFVYTQSVSGGGALAFGEFLKANGYKDVTTVKTTQRTKGAKAGFRNVRKPITKLPAKGKNFIILTGETTVDKASILRIFNDQRNALGEHIQVLIGTGAITQGYTVKDVLEMHVHDPPWNYSTLEQAIGRIIRRDSHTYVTQLKGKVDVRIYLYAGIPDLSSGEGATFAAQQKTIGDTNNLLALAYWNSIDLKKYKKMMEKDREIKNIERIMKEVAFDCPIFYARNAPEGEDYSRECDYALCDYKCDGVDMKEVPGWEKGKPLKIKTIDSNYNLFYSERIQNTFFEYIISQLQEFGFIPISKFSSPAFKKLFLHKLTPLIIGKVLSELTAKKIAFYDKYRFPLTMRSGKGVYFSSSGSGFTGSLPKQVVIKSKDFEYISEVSNQITKEIFCSGKNIDELLDIEVPQIREIIAENAVMILESKVKTTDLAVRVQKKLENKLLDVNGKITSTIMQPDCYRCFDGKTRSKVFCGKKVSWSPVGWKDCEFESSNQLFSLRKLLESAIKNRVRYIGWNDKSAPVLLDMIDLYPEKAIVLELNRKRKVKATTKYSMKEISDLESLLKATEKQPASIDYLTKQKSGKNVDLRKLNTRQKVSSLTLSQLKDVVTNLGKSLKGKNQKSLAEFMIKQLKAQGLWVKNTIEVSRRQWAKVLFKLFSEVAPTIKK